MASKISLNYAGSLASKPGRPGVSPTELEKLSAKLAAANAKFAKQANNQDFNFLRLPLQVKEISNITSLAGKITKQFKNLVVIGIGGSDLGARAALAALKSKYHNELSEKVRGGLKIYFAGDTTDPKPLEELLAVLDLKQTAFQVISKSGGTVETMSAFFVLRDALIKKVGKANHVKHIIVTTTPEQGILAKLVKSEGYLLLPHPPVGGRFSVLSSVGLFALACAGLDIKAMIRGAKDLTKLTSINQVKNNSAFAFAAVNYLAYTKQGRNILVMMPYAYKMAELAKWFRQLWAESLGKNGKGQTPVAALGPTDQHSQLQLYQEGPQDKIFTFIGVAKQSVLKLSKPPVSELDYLNGLNLGDILNAEMNATAQALGEAGRPTNNITLPELNEYYLGQLFFFFELATVYSAELFKLNAFDQPGVELMKKILKKKLQK